MPRTAALTHTTRVEPTPADHDLFTELDHEDRQGKLVLHAPGGRTIELPESLEFQACRERRREATQAISEIVEEHDLPY